MRFKLTIIAVLLAGALALPFSAWANMPWYGPPSMTGTIGNALLVQMKTTGFGENFRGYAFRAALAQRGDRYAWGGAGPDRFDCSGLTMWAYGRAGRSLPHSSYSQQNVTMRLDWAHAHAGDLLFYPGHVEMYAGTYNGTRYSVTASSAAGSVVLRPTRYSGLLKIGGVW